MRFTSLSNQVHFLEFLNHKKFSMFHKGEIFLTGDSNESGGYSIRFRYAHSSVFAHNDTPGEIVDNHIIHAFKRLVMLFNFLRLPGIIRLTDYSHGHIIRLQLHRDTSNRSLSVLYDLCVRTFFLAVSARHSLSHRIRAGTDEKRFCF